ncbi:MAG: PKD domain-containing protein [Myxococcota bacterium]
MTATTTTRRLRPRSLASCAWIALTALALASLGCRAQNGNDSPGGTTAAFAQTATGIAPGASVSFTNGSVGDFVSILWDFGDGTTSTEENPDHTYTAAGTYTVTLTLTTSNGTSSTTSQVMVAGPPTAGLVCTPDEQFAPFTIACSSTATDALNTRYELVATGSSAPPVVVTGAAAAFDVSVAGDYTITQFVDNGVVGDTDSASTNVVAYDLAIVPSVPSGSAPVAGDIVFALVTDAPPPGLPTWLVDGVLSFNGNGAALMEPLTQPGTYTISFVYATAMSLLTTTVSIDYVVGFGPPAADFAVSTSEGPGPLDVTFTDQSTGTLRAWTWDFGDGTTCDFPVPVGADPSDPAYCDSASPTHTYGAIGDYDVTLTITGEDAVGDDVMDTATRTDAVRVTILDPGFESQTADATIAGGWTPITPSAPTATAQPLALASAGGADAGMPTEGSQWAALDGLGTDGSDAALDVQNGIETEFLRPSSASVLEFDYVLLYSEPTAGAVLDAMTATVSDGATIVEIPSARADVTSPYAGGSTRFPTLDGATTRATPVRTASLDLATAFPSAGPDQRYTLTIRLTNDVNDFRSPRAYVDDVRFVAPADPGLAFSAAFSAPATVVAGEAVDFLDETCDGSATCLAPTSHRWDFDTHFSPALLASSGSADADPTYTFAEAGDYDVELRVRNADRESVATMTVTVLEAALAVPAIASASGTTAPATLTFEDRSTSDPSDPIVGWSWDFAGWGTSTAQAPAPVAINQAGTWTVRLTITTASGQTATGSVDVVLD